MFVALVPHGTLCLTQYKADDELITATTTNAHRVMLLRAHLLQLKAIE